MPSIELLLEKVISGIFSLKLKLHMTRKDPPFHLAVFLDWCPKMRWPVSILCSFKWWIQWAFLHIRQVPWWNVAIYLKPMISLFMVSFYTDALQPLCIVMLSKLANPHGAALKVLALIALKEIKCKCVAWAWKDLKLQNRQVDEGSLFILVVNYSGLRLF